MALKTLLAGGLTAVALAGGAAWGYIHYAEIAGGGCGSCSSEVTSCPASECPASESCSESAQPTATPACCDAPSRTTAVVQE